MTDQTIDNPLEGNWYDGIAGEDQGRIDVFKEFESADKFYENYQSLSNRNWRTEIAGEDEALATQLERYSSPTELGASWKEQRAKISEGIKPAELPENATDADIAAYRKTFGIPAEAEGYYEGLPDGVVIGEEDKPIADAFMNAIHGAHARPAVAHALIGAYNEFSEQEQAAQQELDGQQSAEATDALREAWGTDYRTNLNLVEAFLTNTFGEAAKEQLMNGRYGDGRGFMNDPDVLKGFAAAQRQLDPTSTIVPRGDESAMQTLDDEIKEIEDIMRTKRYVYNKDEKMQARYRELLQLRIDAAEKAKNAA